MTSRTRRLFAIGLIACLGVVTVSADQAAAQPLARLCKRECGSTIESVCAETTTRRQFRLCRNIVLKTCRQRGLDVCSQPAAPAPSAPPVNPACGPVCPTGEPAVWTGTITSSDGATAELVASMCPTTNGVLTGGWSCTPETGACVAPGGSLQATLIGANFTARSNVGSSFIDPVWGCDLTGVLTGATLNGSYRCQGYGGTLTGTWRATACS
jgi:hypothetical protein